MGQTGGANPAVDPAVTPTSTTTPGENAGGAAEVAPKGADTTPVVPGVPATPAWQQAGLTSEADLEKLKTFAKGQGQELDTTNAQAIVFANSAHKQFTSNADLVRVNAELNKRPEVAPTVTPEVAPVVTPPVTPEVAPAPAPAPTLAPQGNTMTAAEVKALLEAQSVQLRTELSSKLLNDVKWNTLVSSNPAAASFKPMVDSYMTADPTITMESAYELATANIKSMAESLGLGSQGSPSLPSSMGVSSGVGQPQVKTMTRAQVDKLPREEKFKFFQSVQEGKARIS